MSAADRRAATPAAPTPTDEARRRVARALSRCAASERVLLALLLFERLTVAEAAEALSVPLAHVEARFEALLAELGAAARGATFRNRRAAPVAVRLRRAS